MDFGNWTDMGLNLGDMTDMGPLEVLYHLADKLLSATERHIAPPAFLMSDFIETVTWTEPFILGLLVCQLLTFLTVLLTRRKIRVQIGVFMFITTAVLFSERLNNLGRVHWPRFATQNYFDRNGLFAMIFFAGPFLVYANLILINVCVKTAKMAIVTKRMQMRSDAATRQTNGATGGHEKSQ